MKKLLNKTQGLIRGTSSSVLLSIAIHAAVFFLAGIWVVVRIVNPPEAAFVPPPPVERKPMKIKKPRVKVKKASRPRSARRISVSSPVAAPDIALPEMSGTGGGLGGGMEGFTLVPDIPQMNPFGSDVSIESGNDFEGTFYCFNHRRDGKKTTVDRDTCQGIIRKFHNANWNDNTFGEYFRANRKIYTTFFMVPSFPSEFGPQAFGQSDDERYEWQHYCVVYRGKIAAPRDGQYRFWGSADTLIMIRINGKLVFEDSWDDNVIISDWRSTAEGNNSYHLTQGGAVIGDWFELKAGESVDMDVLFYENGGSSGRGNLAICIEEEAEEYDVNSDGKPIIPIFKTAQIPEMLKEQIQYDLMRDDVDLDSGPVFNLY